MTELHRWPFTPKKGARKRQKSHQATRKTPVGLKWRADKITAL